MKKVYFLFLLTSICLAVSGQSSFSWNFGTASPNPNPSAGLPVSGLTVSAISQGNNNGVTELLTTTSASSGYTGASGTYNAGAAARIGSLNTAAGGSAYFEFTLSPQNGRSVTVSQISFGARSTTTGPQAYAIRSSKNNYATNYAEGTIANNSSWSLKQSNLSIEGAENEVIVIRIYGYDGSGSASANTANWRIDDLAVTVTVSGSSSAAASVTAGNHAAEPSTNGSFLIELSAPAPAGGISVNYTLGGTATTSDYSNSQTGSVTIPEGQSSGTVIIYVTDDDIIEPQKTITLTLTGATSPYTASGTATINLVDDDVAPELPIELTGSYSQNFDLLAGSGTGNSWTNSSTLPGWYASRTSYDANTGSGTTGTLYSYGLSGSTDRALGSLASNGTGTIYYGVRFKNNTGVPITSLKVRYKGEQWRNGGSGLANTLLFSYRTSTSAITSLTSGTWTHVGNLNFVSPVSSSTAAALNGNLDANSRTITYTITNLNIGVGEEIMLRWTDLNEEGSDDGLAVDNLNVEANPNDVTPPAIVTLSPVSGASSVPSSFTAVITFDEAVVEGSGNIYLRRTSDQSIVQTITLASVTTSNNTASFAVSGLQHSTSYYFEIDEGAFKDESGNSFGISGNQVWSFTTGNVLFAANFQGCTATLTDGFAQYSSQGSIVWACTPFGRDPQAPSGTAQYPSAVQINGFAGGTNVPNVDWLISPSVDLTGTTYPLLSFWSRTAFNGAPLQLKVSTNYNGGDPSLATWVDINGRFPNQASNIWTLSSNINLSEFKQPNVRFAFVYTSTDDDGARWTVDDITLINSATPPPPSLTVPITDLKFGFAAIGTSVDKSILVRGNDLSHDISVASDNNIFLVSRDGITFSPQITYTAEEANNVPLTVYLRFTPTQNNQNFAGTITVTTGSLSSQVNVKGTSIDPATTLEVMNWNIEWFGHTGMGPSNEAQQEQNVVTILKNVNADIYALTEIVSEQKLASVVGQLPGYSYVISNYGSHTNPYSDKYSSLDGAQKLAFVFKTSVFQNVTAEPLLSQGINTQADISNPAYSYWASGRFPYMFSADMTLNCVTKHVKFVLVHGKANTSPTRESYERRKKGSDTLHYTLKQLYPNEHIIILGDLNDDLDQTITADAPTTVTSYSAFTTDPDNYFSPTLALSLAGKKSTVKYNDIIDHVIVSNEVQPYYMPSTASILTDVTAMVSSYGTTTSDHYPVFTRYRFEEPSGPTITTCPSVDPVCENESGSYTIPVLAATGCGTVTYSYTISGATQRSGNSANASGSFQPGTSVITWTVSDASGKTANCTTTVVINNNPVVTVNSPVKCANDPEVTLSASPATGNTDDYNYSWTVPQGAANPGNHWNFTSGAEGVYSVVATSKLTGCAGTGSGSLTVNPNPVVTLNSATRCSNGDPVTLTASPASSGSYQYTWTVPTNVVNPGNQATIQTNTGGNYSVVITNSTTGCASQPAIGTVTVYTSPVVSIPDAFALPSGTVANTVYIGYTPASSITLTPSVAAATASYDYAWSHGVVSGPVTVSPNQPTNYTVTVTDGNGCAASASQHIDVKDIRAGKKLNDVWICHRNKSVVVPRSDVADHLAHGDMLNKCEGVAGMTTGTTVQEANVTLGLKASAAPNPSAQQFVISIEGVEAGKMVSVRVIDASGRAVEEHRVVDPRRNMVLGAWYRPGIYLVEIWDGNRKTVLKLVKTGK